MGWDLHPWEGAVEEEGFLHPGKPPHQRDLPGRKGSFRASKENAAAQSRRKTVQMVMVATWNTSLPVWARKVLELRLSEIGPGERTKISCAETAWEMVLESSVTTTEGVHGGSPGHLRGQVSLEVGSTTVAFFFVHKLTEGRTPPALVPVLVTNYHHLPCKL